MSTDRRRYELKARAARQRETRERIVAVTEELHREVGPARTTIADVARRAGVERLTVYNHFPELKDLLAACQARFLSSSPPPDLVAAADLQAALLLLYRWFRAGRDMQEHVHRDRHLVPELDDLLRQSSDVSFDAAAAAHAKRLAGSARRRAAAGRIIRVALEFRTWQLLAEQGVSDREIAALFADAARCVAGPKSWPGPPPGS